MRLLTEQQSLHCERNNIVLQTDKFHKDFNADWVIICWLTLWLKVMTMHNKPTSGPADGPKQCLNTSQTTISYTSCRHARCNRFLPSLISITPQAQLRLPVLEAVVSKNMALTRLSTPTLGQL